MLPSSGISSHVFQNAHTEVGDLIVDDLVIVVVPVAIRFRVLAAALLDLRGNNVENHVLKDFSVKTVLQVRLLTSESLLEGFMDYENFVTRFRNIQHCDPLFSECLCDLSKGKCDVVSGECACLPGFKGKYCLAEHECGCKNGAKCEELTNKCVCEPGFHGALCEQKCDRGWFGEYCTQKCNCLNENECDAVTGKCICVGFTGEKCEKPCGLGSYGPDVGTQFTVDLLSPLSKF